jgi:hypothetical protein
VALVTGCFEQPFAPDESNDRLTITNDEDALGDRVSYPDEDVPIASFSAAMGSPSAAPSAMASSSINMTMPSITLTLNAEVLPPTVSGQVVQATSVWATQNDEAVVSYNMRGSLALGALDYFNKLDNGRPRLRSSVSFNDSDVSATFTDGSWAYSAVATQDVSFPFPAVLERIRITGNKFQLDENLRVPLTSFVGTSAMSTGSEIYATSGDGGDVFAFDAVDLSLLGQYALDDARWVAWDQNNARVVVLQGTPGRLSVFAEGEFPGGSMTLLNTFPFPGADVPESKSAVEVVGGKAFIAAGPDGVQVVCLDNGQIVGSVPRPDPASLGLDPSVVVTNAVTVQDDLMFISNGEAGVYAAAGAESFETSSCDAPQQITVLGQLQFDALQSVNHVVYVNDRLYIAAGLGGIKVVDVVVN